MKTSMPRKPAPPKADQQSPDISPNRTPALQKRRGYAIQDTPDTIAEHYGRFLPQDKAAIAAGVVNKVWAA